MIEPIGYFKLSTAQSILAAHSARITSKTAPPNSQAVVGTGNPSTHTWSNYVLSSLVSGNVWNAKQCSDAAAPMIGAVDEYVKVLGPPMKAGLMVSAHLDNMSNVLTAHGYESRILDWGTAGNVSPFIVEDVSGVLTPRIKTKKTTNGIVWTEEKINMSGKECT